MIEIRHCVGVRNCSRKAQFFLLFFLSQSWLSRFWSCQQNIRCRFCKKQVHDLWPHLQHLRHMTNGSTYHHPLPKSIHLWNKALSFLWGQWADSTPRPWTHASSFKQICHRPTKSLQYGQILEDDHFRKFYPAFGTVISLLLYPLVMTCSTSPAWLGLPLASFNSGLKQR